MRQANRRIGLVDVLAARARCPVGIYAQVGGIDLFGFHLVGDVVPVSAFGKQAESWNRSVRPHESGPIANER